MFANEALIKQNDAEHSTYVTCHHSFFSSFGTDTAIALLRCAASLCSIGYIYLGSVPCIHSRSQSNTIAHIKNPFSSLIRIRRGTSYDDDTTHLKAARGIATDPGQIQISFPQRGVRFQHFFKYVFQAVESASSFSTNLVCQSPGNWTEQSPIMEVAVVSKHFLLVDRTEKDVVL